LKKEFDISTLEEVEELQNILDGWVTDLEKQIETLVGEIREVMEGVQG